MRYPVSGVATQVVHPNTSTGATGVTTLLSITSGRVFWLRGLTFLPSGTAGNVEIFDATSQASATSPLKIALAAASALVQVTPAVYSFDAPGIKFSNNYVLARLAASGSIAAGGMAIWGFEE